MTWNGNPEHVLVSLRHTDDAPQGCPVVGGSRAKRSPRKLLRLQHLLDFRGLVRVVQFVQQVLRCQLSTFASGVQEQSVISARAASLSQPPGWSCVRSASPGN
jgi:hypothetical protein